MNESDIRKSVRLNFPEKMTWFDIPSSIPHRSWETSEDWARAMTIMIYTEVEGEYDGSEARVPWLTRTSKIIEAAYNDLPSNGARYRFLLFHDLNKVPTPLWVHTAPADQPWAEIRPLLTGELATEDLVGKPTILPFDVAGNDEGVRSLRYYHLDRKAGTKVGKCDYGFRRSGIDVVVRAEYIDVDTIPDAVQTLHTFVSAITLEFDDPAAG